MNIDKLNFGAPSAERDITIGLSEYFCETAAFSRISSGQRFIILGNRGSGKSAIFKIVSEREKKSGTIVVELSPEEYSYEILNTALARESQGSWVKQGAYTSAWKYLLFVIIMKKLSLAGPRIKTGALGRIYEYLRDNHKNTQENPISVLVSYLKRIEGLKIGNYEASLKTKELNNLYKLEEINDLIPDVIEVLKKKKMIILVDELDKGWDASEDAKCFVAGLFHAVIAVNQISPNLKIFISLRRELYENIPALYEDAQKISDVIETITWDEPSLFELINKRIKYFVPELNTKTNENVWNSIFSEIIEYRSTKSFNYIIDRTLNRPRELIQICISSLDEAKKRKILPMAYEDISRAELSYSEQRTKDISAEYKFQFPGLLSVFESFRGMPYNFSREELELVCLKLSTGEIKVDQTANWILDQDPENLIENLWKIGFIRAKAVGGVKTLRRSGSSYLGSYQINNLNLRNIKNFHVHPMFRSYLSLKETREKRDDNE